jgi:L-fucose mutarotase/ribose pyranase (RbsD/FucU family)
MRVKQLFKLQDNKKNIIGAIISKKNKEQKMYFLKFFLFYFTMISAFAFVLTSDLGIYFCKYLHF